MIKSGLEENEFNIKRMALLFSWQSQLTGKIEIDFPPLPALKGGGK